MITLFSRIVSCFGQLVHSSLIPTLTKCQNNGKCLHGVGMEWTGGIKCIGFLFMCAHYDSKFLKGCLETVNYYVQSPIRYILWNILKHNLRIFIVMSHWKSNMLCKLQIATLLIPSPFHQLNISTSHPFWSKAGSNFRDNFSSLQSFHVYCSQRSTSILKLWKLKIINYFGTSTCWWRWKARAKVPKRSRV